MPFSVPVIITDVEAETPDVATLKVADVWPAGTVTVNGTVALVLPDERLTMAPPVAAGPFSVTVPVEGFPPTILVGTRATLAKPAGLIVRISV